MRKDDILLKFNEEFHNRFAMQECDVMFYFKRSESVQVIDISRAPAPSGAPYSYGKQFRKPMS